MVIPPNQELKQIGSSESGDGSSSSALTLRLELADEITRLRSFATDWKGGRRKVRFWTKVIVRLVKGML